MALRGEVHDEHGQELRPQHVIFADTGDEPRHGGPFKDNSKLAQRHGLGVYGWLNFLRAETARLAPQIQFHVVQRRSASLSERSLEMYRSKKSGKRYLKTMMPLFVRNGDGKVAALLRKCTEDYKIVPINRKLRELAQPRRGEKNILVEQWIGISVD
jgi:hypothetical protein